MGVYGGPEIKAIVGESGEFWRESGHVGPESAHAANLGPDADSSPSGLAVGGTSRIMPAGWSVHLSAMQRSATLPLRVGEFQ